MFKALLRLFSVPADSSAFLNPWDRNEQGFTAFDIEVVGVEYRGDNLTRIVRTIPSTVADVGGIRITSRVVGKRREDREHSPKKTARLVSEPHNAHDRNAIRVEIHGLHIGYLKRKTAAHITEVARLRGHDGIDIHCPCLIEFDARGCALFVDVGNQLLFQDPFYVKRWPFEFYVMDPNRTLPSEFRNVGTSVNFWARPSQPWLIHVYVQGGVDGDSLLGYVPTDLAPTIRRRIALNEPLTGSLLAIEGGSFRISASNQGDD